MTMPPLPSPEIDLAWEDVQKAKTNNEKGLALEKLVSLLFGSVPGTRVGRQRVPNAFETEEVDLLLWNEKLQDGFYFMPHLIPVECKNWTNPVGSKDVDYFCGKLELCRYEYGVLIAANGISGDKDELTDAQFIVASHLAKGIRVLVIKLDDLKNVNSTESLVELVIQKTMDLHSRGFTA